jgi:hypothetical protein
MSERFHCLRAAFRRLFLLDPLPEPDEDEVSKVALLQWVAARKHPAECMGGCQCRPDRR